MSKKENDMTLQEFKAWFDGFTENVTDKGPTLKQWKRVKERVGEIDGVGVTERVYIDRYFQPYRYYYSSPTITGITGVGVCSTNTVSLQNAGYAPGSDYTSNGVQGGGAAFASNFNGMVAMHAAGQAEAASMN
jgi:hypothetical protein